MQVDNYTSQSFRAKSSSRGLTTSQMNFISQTQSPTLINKQLSSKQLDNYTYKDKLFAKTLPQDTFSTNLHSDSSQLNQWQNQYSRDLASKPTSQTSYPKNNSLDLAGLLGKVSPSEQTIKNQSASNGFQQSEIDTPVEYRLMKIENQTLKTENKKLNETVYKLRKELEDKVSTLTKFNQLMKIKYSELKEIKATLEQKEQLIETLEKKTQNTVKSSEAQKLKELLMRKNKELEEINSKINNLEYDNFKNEVFQTKVNKLYEELEEEKGKTNNYLLENSALSQKIIELEEQVSVLEFEKQKNKAVGKVAEISQIENLFRTPESSPSKSNKQIPSQSTHLTAFEEALRVQMKQIEELKQVIDNSTEVVQKLRDNLITSRRELEELRNEMKILDLKASSERKKLIMEYRLQIHEKDNEINTILKKHKTLQEKYKNSLVEIKAKDDFFRQYLLGRTTEVPVQQSIEATLKEYTENFDSIISLKTENSSLKERLEKYQMYEKEVEECSDDGKDE